MHYEHPLAYLIGIEGAALMRAFNGEHDRAFVEARLAEVRRLIDAAELNGRGVDVERVDTVDGYHEWAHTYDNPHNELLKLDLPAVRDVLTGIEPGLVLDAACGTGRLASVAAEIGHRVVGVDSSPDMLDYARANVPGGDFQLGDLHDLPLADGAIDAVLCGLALAHVPSFDAIFTEFARVLRPGGHLVISDVHPELVAWGSIPPVRVDGGRPGRIATYRHRTGDYLRAALAAGLEVQRCDDVEIRRTGDGYGAPDDAPGMPEELVVEPWGDWPWVLTSLVPAAAKAVAEGMPGVIVWHFVKP